ncbi:MAG: signal recognition particle-docking protein FtsY [Planctomycetes bacterium]|nr:signal recognition particle-docking protein FtsY [Planctomycetota bacterium]
MPLRALIGKLRQGLAKTRARLTEQLRDLFSRGLDEATLEEVEELLYSADIGPTLVARVVEDLRTAVREKRLASAESPLAFLEEDFVKQFSSVDTSLHLPTEPPAVILVVGVNGSGKTTSIAKLAKMFRDEGKKVLLAASDTFRAAGIEQLLIWAQRVDADVVKHQPGADPAAVAYDAAEAALARGTDVLIVDTAGRVHTHTNLMRELEKIGRVLGNKVPQAPHEVLLVLDATTGQNAISQARLFQEAVQVTGIMLAKLDGTAKGGIVLAIQQQLGIPVKFIGLGEGTDDLQPFEPRTFVQALLE